EKGAGSLQAVGQHCVEKPRARVPEVRADRMLLIEGLKWPRVGRGRGARAQGQTTDQEEGSEAHGSSGETGRRRLAGPPDDANGGRASRLTASSCSARGCPGGD